MLMSFYGFSRGYDNLILLVILVLYRLLVLRSTGKSKYQCTHYPIGSTIYHSLFSTGNAIHPSNYIGLENYNFLMEDDIFWKVLKNNMIYSMCTVPLSIGFALGIALLINRNIKGRSLVRMSFFTSTCITNDCGSKYLAVFLISNIRVKRQGGMLFRALSGEITVMAAFQQAG